MTTLLSGHTKDVLILDDFFDDFEFLLPHIKDIELYDYESFPEDKSESTWPGYRSRELQKFRSPFLLSLFLKTLKKQGRYWSNTCPATYIHLRDECNRRQGLGSSGRKPYQLPCLSV